MIVILCAGLIAIALATALAVAFPALARPTLAFGVRVSEERVDDPAVIAARRSYARSTVAAGALVAVVTVPVLLVTRSADAIGVTTSVLAVLDVLLFHRAHRMIRTAKLTGGWAAERRQGVAVDTTFRTDPVRVPWPWALPALAVVLLTVGVGWARYGTLPATLPPLLGYAAEPARREPTTVLSAFLPVIFQLALILIAVALVLVVLRARPELDAARPRGSARRYRVYLRGTAVMVLLTAACLDLSLLLAALRLWEIVTPSALWQVIVYAPLFLPVGGWLVWEVKVGQAGHRLPALPGEEQEDSGLGQRDDDQYWYLAGSIYVNRRDPALLVHDRLVSWSWTLNLGHPVAWILLGALAVGLVVLLVLVLPGAD
ncbi:hypothetical protein E1267_03735 [Nonomuraea longispora]|uniref:DUF5808 domain-containing protein n=1 Tax=Nonomuraea longispora TaxID=1848320 RepID=A0A4R4NN84_9ACTN|nr:hypothetical protein [Nonomuraea longispora]TDC10669.1 hypothetical protein E1267_03735 [Nonomuraea longispora]